MNVRRLLVPTDFSAQSNYSIREALLLASTFGASLRLVHVGVLPAATKDVATHLRIFVNEDDAERRLEAEQLEARQRVQGTIEIERELLFGAPANVIVESAARWDADLIVMGSHGRSALPRLLLGSVTETVVRTAGCPVWVIPSHLHRVVRAECERFNALES